MMDRIGTCSLCGGPVVVPCHMVNPVPHCERCGAIPKVPHGPVIDMERPIKRTGWGCNDLAPVNRQLGGMH